MTVRLPPRLGVFALTVLLLGAGTGCTTAQQLLGKPPREQGVFVGNVALNAMGAIALLALRRGTRSDLVLRRYGHR